MNILGIISSLNDPASRFRIIQYKELFETANHRLIYKGSQIPRSAEAPAWTKYIRKLTSINEYRTWDIFKQCCSSVYLLQQFTNDIIWQNRLIVPHHSFIERNFRKPLVFDIDDAVWITEGEKSLQKALQKATMVFAGNEYLADYVQQHNKNVHVIPTAVNTEIMKPLQREINKFTVGWIGSSSNFQYLELIKTTILDFLRTNPDSRLLIVSSEKPPQFVFDNERIQFRQWLPDRENDLINEMSVGIMPITEDAWSKGKCGFKILQYMACGKPIIATPVGMNKHILNSGDIGFGATTHYEWTKALYNLKNDRALYSNFSYNARNLVKNKFSTNHVFPLILANFQNILPN